jgi:hypothetical protein
MKGDGTSQMLMTWRRENGRDRDGLGVQRVDQTVREMNQMNTLKNNTVK